MGDAALEPLRLAIDEDDDGGGASGLGECAVMMRELQTTASYEAVHGAVDVANMVYALALTLVLMVSGRRAELDIGLWFGWQALACVFVAAQYPLLGRAAIYVRELYRRGDPAASRSHFAFSPAWLAGAQSRAAAQVLISLGFLGADAAYLVLRLLELSRDCGDGTSCRAHYSIHLLVVIAVGTLVFLALMLLWSVSRVVYWIASLPLAAASLPATSRASALSPPPPVPFGYAPRVVPAGSQLMHRKTMFAL